MNEKLNYKRRATRPKPPPSNLLLLSPPQPPRPLLRPPIRPLHRLIRLHPHQQRTHPRVPMWTASLRRLFGHLRLPSPLLLLHRPPLRPTQLHLNLQSKKQSWNARCARCVKEKKSWRRSEQHAPPPWRSRPQALQLLLLPLKLLHPRPIHHRLPP